MSADETLNPFLLSLLARIAEAHGLPGERSGSVYRFDGIVPTARCFWHDDGDRLARVELRVSLDDDREVVESVTGTGSTLTEQLLDGFGRLCDGTLVALLTALFGGPASPHAARHEWVIGGRERPVTVGSVTTIVGYPRGEDGSPDRDLLGAFMGALRGALESLPVPEGIHWVSVYARRCGGRSAQTDALFDNEPEAEIQRAVDELPWPAQNDAYDVRVFMVIGDADAAREYSAPVCDYSGVGGECLIMARQQEPHNARGVHEGAVAASHIWGHDAAWENDFVAASVAYQNALTVYEQRCDKRGVQKVNEELGQMWAQHRCFTEAMSWLLKYLAISEELGSVLAVANACLHLGEVTGSMAREHVWSNDLARAAAQFEDSGRWLIRSVSSFEAAKEPQSAAWVRREFAKTCAWASAETEAKLATLWREAGIGTLPVPDDRTRKQAKQLSVPFEQPAYRTLPAIGVVALLVFGLVLWSGACGR